MTTPIIHLFCLTVADGNQSRFQAIGLKNLTTSQEQEPGTLAMYASPIKGQETVSYVFEVYRSEEDYQIHRASPQYRYFVTEAGPLMTERQAYDVQPIFLQEKLPAGQWTQPNDFYLKFAQLEVKEEGIGDFQAIVTEEMVASMEKETGVLAMYAMADTQKSNHFYFFEVYADEAAYLNHRETPHFKDYIEGTADLVCDKQLYDLYNGTAISQGELKTYKR